MRIRSVKPDPQIVIPGTSVCPQCGVATVAEGCCSKACKKRLRHRNYTKQWAKKNPERRRRTVQKWQDANKSRIADYKFRKRYGITLDQVEAMRLTQAGRCAVCGRSEDEAGRLHLDHDHTSRTTRELLCGSCNRAVGLAHESPGLLRALADYLERHRRAVA